MDSSKDIYHKADTAIPPRRKGRTMSEPFVRSVPLSDSGTPASSGSTLPGATPLGTQHIGAPISPVQIARQQMQMNPEGHLRRRRRRRDPGEHRTRRYNRVVLLLVILVVLAYLAILGVKFWNNWRNPKTVVATTTKTTVPPAKIIRDEGTPADAGQPVADRVYKWGRGLRALEEARTLMNSGRLIPAKEKLKLAAEALPTSPEQMLGNARVSFAERDYKTAERLLLAVVESDPSNPDARELLASALFENGRYADALAIAEWICTLDPYSAPAHETAANAALTQQINDASKAIEHLKKLSTLRSDDFTIKNNLGKAYLRAADYAGARRIYEDLLKADDLNSAAHYNLAICQVKQNKPDEAVATLHRAATKLDLNFVSTWLSSSDFATLHAHPDFIALQRRLGSTPSIAPGDSKKP